jgi:hypothetical protein
MKHISRVAVKKKGAAAHLDSWRRSSEWRAIAKRQCEKLNRERLTKPKCEAARKLDGQPCQNLAMKNGRCRFHGGKTPKGDSWHVTLWPAKTEVRAMKKLSRKLQDAERDAEKLRQRIAVMSPEERAAYEKRKRKLKPGPAAARALKRKEAKDAADFRERWASPKKETLSPEAHELRARRARNWKSSCALWKRSRIKSRMKIRTQGSEHLDEQRDRRR